MKHTCARRHTNIAHPHASLGSGGHLWMFVAILVKAPCRDPCWRATAGPKLACSTAGCAGFEPTGLQGRLAGAPVRGPAPGCPAATHWLALVALCWSAEVRKAGCEPRRLGRGWHAAPAACVPWRALGAPQDWQRMRVLTTAGYPAALYGIEPSAWPRATVALARKRGHAPEAFGCLAARRWRDDHGAQRGGWVPERLTPLVRAGWRVGPAAAARGALWDRRNRGGRRPGRVASVVPSVPSSEWRSGRLAAYGVATARHADFRAVPAPDSVATRRELGRSRPADQAAALHAVLLGCAVPQAVAAH